MEIGEETAHPLKFVGGVDKCRSGAMVGLEGGGGFEDAGGGGPNGDETFRGGSFCGKSCRDFITFRMHRVITKVLGFDGSKSSETYVECDKSVGKLSKEFGSEVKAGGGCGYGA